MLGTGKKAVLFQYKANTTYRKRSRYDVIPRLCVDTTLVHTLNILPGLHHIVQKNLDFLFFYYLCKTMYKYSTPSFLVLLNGWCRSLCFLWNSKTKKVKNQQTDTTHIHIRILHNNHQHFIYFYYIWCTTLLCVGSFRCDMCRSSVCLSLWRIATIKKEVEPYPKTCSKRIMTHITQ